MIESDSSDIDARLTELTAAPPTKDDVNLWLQRLGEHLGIGGLALDGDGTAVLAIDGSEVVITWIDEASSLTATAMVGSATDCSPGLLRGLLRANGDWQATLGGAVGIDPTGRHIVLGRSLLPAGGDAERLDRDLAALVDLARAWRLQLAAYVGDDPRTPADASATKPLLRV